MKIKYYVLSMDNGKSFLPEILEYDSTIPDYFEGVKSPKKEVLFDTWAEAHNFLIVFTSQIQAEVAQNLEMLGKRVQRLIKEPTTTEDDILLIIRQVQEQNKRNEAGKEYLIKLVKIYGEKYGDVTQEMLEAVTLLS